MSTILALTVLAAGPFLGAEVRVASLQNPSDPVVVSSSDAVLLAWTEGSRVRARVGEGTRDLGTGYGVAAASDGRDFLIVWQEGQRISGARWSDPANVRPYFNGTATHLPVVVWDGSAFLVFGQFVDTAAALPNVLLTVTYRAEREGYRCKPGGFTPNCGVFPAEYTVEWRTHTANGPSRPHGAFNGGFYAPYPPGAAAGKNEFAVAWRTQVSIDGRRVLADAAAAGFFSIPLPHPLTGRRGPQIAWDGTRYLVVFDMVGQTGDIWGAVVLPRQTVIAEPFLIAGGAEEEFSPSVTALGADRFLVAYTIGKDAIGTRVVSFREPAGRRRATW